ncbi:spore morphogenesis/germination protein YwcE [Alkalicoccobacillus porphyridii]|uniref:Spore gernimation protein n=1 Tax=Alkalicoccobacillus porphyridii TaxID=2597270 RepID=A0A553ZUK7_9BACI|nr:spore morphogenesis/germination protein YwcE [Alkalicoccobacillus porphyridii]TSB45139.1 spore gernimation protein [Alkalicoccobacillus porphyridii]
MGVFFFYMFVASATPLFLWIEYHKIAVASIPGIFAMWILGSIYIISPSWWLEAWFIFTFAVNVILAHWAAIVLYGMPFIRARRLQSQPKRVI